MFVLEFFFLTRPRHFGDIAWTGLVEASGRESCLVHPSTQLYSQGFRGQNQSVDRAGILSRGWREECESKFIQVFNKIHFLDIHFLQPEVLVFLWTVGRGSPSAPRNSSWVFSISAPPSEKPAMEYLLMPNFSHTLNLFHFSFCSQLKKTPLLKGLCD